MDNLNNESIKELNVIDYRIDKYNIYHVYFNNEIKERYRYFLNGYKLEKFFLTKKIELKFLNKNEIIKLLNNNKDRLKFTLDLDSIYKEL